jgi:hypothetical protein
MAIHRACDDEECAGEVGFEGFSGKARSALICLDFCRFRSLVGDFPSPQRVTVSGDLHERKVKRD